MLIWLTNSLSASGCFSHFSTSPTTNSTLAKSSIVIWFSSSFFSSTTGLAGVNASTCLATFFGSSLANNTSGLSVTLVPEAYAPK